MEHNISCSLRLQGRISATCGVFGTLSRSDEHNLVDGSRDRGLKGLQGAFVPEHSNLEDNKMSNSMKNGRPLVRLSMAALIAMPLALAGCGGGSDDEPAMPETPAPEMPAAPSPVERSGMAATAALNAATEAMEAETKANAAAKALTTLTVKGNSAEAQANAQAILDADETVKAQVIVATQALAEIKAAIADLPAGSTDLESLQDDERSATDHLATINAINLEAEVYAVRGQTEKEPIDFNDDVAKAIQALFTTDATATNDAALWLTIGDGDSPTALSATNVINHHNTTGPTDTQLKYGEIYYSAEGMKLDLRDFRTGPGATDVVKGLDVSGAMLSDFVDRDATATEDAVLTTADAGEAATTARLVTYKGINGTLTCYANCAPATSGGALSGNWYIAFLATDTAASDPHALYLMVENKYIAMAGGSVSYGYWLEMVDHDSNAATAAIMALRTFAVPSDDVTDYVANSASSDATANTGPTKATYSGGAAGMAVVRTVDPNAPATVTSRSSGGFTADVSLTADFTGGATGQPELRGEISNFGGAADPTWRVELRPANIAPATGLLDGESIAVGYRGTSQATNNGSWTAQMYGGGANKRPDGVYGGFGAYFPNGEAVGGYQAQ